jgi:hypothetical protein
MRGTGQIAFSLPREMPARLSILDLQGREVAVLAEGVMPAGPHTASWDGRGLHGTAPAGRLLRAARRRRPRALAAAGPAAGEDGTALNGAVGRGAGVARALSLVLLAVATLAAFAGMSGHGWILLDDPLYVTRDPHVARGLTLDGLRWFLLEPHGQNWHPLTSASHMLDVSLFGLAPAGHHAVNLLLHVVNAVLLALVLFRLTGAWWRSVLVAALFALHPLRVESVAWISERKDVLSGLFFLLTLAAYGRWAARPSRARSAAGGGERWRWGS